MNYLAHLFLSPENTEIKIGNLMGDFVKGKQFPSFSDDIIHGIYLHRAIDKFTDSHDDVKSLKEHLSPERRRFHGIIADIAFDHFLAKHWTNYSTISLVDFITRSYQELNEHKAIMPERMQFMVSKMVSNDWLSQYQFQYALCSAIDGVSKRIKFENKLLGGGKEVLQCYEHYQDVFEVFFPQLVTFVKNYSFDGEKSQVNHLT